MKHVIVMLLLAAMSMAADDVVEKCRAIAPWKILCKQEISSNTVIAIYSKDREGVWWGKEFYPYIENLQTKAVRVLVSGDSLDYKGWCEKVRLENPNSVDTSMTCETAHFIIRRVVETGNNDLEFSIPGIFKNRKFLNVIYCLNSTYVRKFRYDKITQLEIDRKDYYDIKPGNYCEEFLSSDDYFWEPSKSR